MCRLIVLVSTERSIVKERAVRDPAVFNWQQDSDLKNSRIKSRRFSPETVTVKAVVVDLPDGLNTVESTPPPTQTCVSFSTSWPSFEWT